MTELQCEPVEIVEEAIPIEYIKNLDDVVEVVRCKDCIYSPSGDTNGEDQGFSLEWPHDHWPERNPCPYKCDDGWYSHKPKPEFYCANGKKEDRS